MSDDLEEDEPESTPKQLREAAKRGREAEARAEAAERELAFAKAGIDLGDEKNQFFLDGYKGPLTREDIRESAEKHGFLNKPVPETEPVSPDEQAAIQRMSQATEGAETPPPPDAVAEINDLERRALTEKWSREKFENELANQAHLAGRPAELDGQEFVYREV